MSTNIKTQAVIRRSLALLAVFGFAGCATNFEPTPLSADHPASVQAQEAPRTGTRRFLATDAITRKTTAQLARKDAPDSDFQSGGMSHDMSSMGGMDHSQIKGMEGMDHSKMPGMTMPAPSAAASPASKEAAELEMKKTSDEMKKLSDEMKAKSDTGKSTKKPSSKPAQGQQTEAAYWTCVMHPEIHEDKPGQCPKCGMTLVKKEGATK